jgi:threonine aldolase
MIDLRSDTLTKPTPPMREAMATAVVGDDVYGEDPTINELEAKAAELLGHEAALFCATGSLANLLGVWLVAERGTELVCDEQAHIVRAEVGAHAALHGIQTRTWASPDGVADPAVVARIIADRAHHLVATGGVELENTHNFGGGTIQPVEAVEQIAAVCADKGLGLHLDGARLGNAAVALGRPLSDWSALATSVTLCLSKGLGAPVGTILASSAENIARARGQRKRLGGGWRQAGILAAAGIYALDHHLDRLADDNANARLIGDAVRAAAPAAIGAVPTNIVVIHTADAPGVAARAKAEGVLVSALNATTLRAVTHLDVTRAQCQEAAEILAALVTDSVTEGGRA